MTTARSSGVMGPTWLCGGTIRVAKSSYVAHAFRDRFPYAVGSGGGVDRR